MDAVFTFAFSQDGVVGRLATVVWSDRCQVRQIGYIIDFLPQVLTLFALFMLTRVSQGENKM